MSSSSFPSHYIKLLGLVYFLYFAQLGVMTPYLGVFLDGRGFSSVQIGELLAFITLMRIIGPNLWAGIADRTGQYLSVIRVGAFAAVLSFCLMLFDNDYWGIALTMGLVMMFWTAILPQLEVVTMNSVASDSARYGRIRLWGSLGYILFSVLLGYLLDLFHSDVVVWTSVVVLLGLSVATLLMRSPTTIQTHKNSFSELWQQLLSRPFVAFMLSAFALQVSFGAFYSFFALYMLDLGYSGQQTGWLIALGVMAEVILFMRVGKLLSRFTLRSLLIVCALVACIRWGLTATLADTFLFLILAQLSHAVTFGLAHATSIQFLHGYFPAQYRSRGQALYVSLAFGGGGALGSLIAGHLWQQGDGAELTFLSASAAACVALLAACWLPKSQSHSTV